MSDFLESVRRGVERGITSVGAKSRELLETSELRSQARALDERRRAAIEELGNIAHVMLKRGALDEARLREKSEAIARLEAEIKDCEERIEAVHRRTLAVMGQPGAAVVGRCGCGAAVLEGARFCGSCGTKADGGSAATPQEGPACPQCGGSVRAGARFCGGCGAGLAG